MPDQLYWAIACLLRYTVIPSPVVRANARICGATSRAHACVLTHARVLTPGQPRHPDQTPGGSRTLWCVLPAPAPARGSTCGTLLAACTDQPWLPPGARYFRR